MYPKRSRKTFEEEDPPLFALYGTPLPHDASRDQGAFVPVWKQEVTDERGRKRLHGAFTGGWSAGYFNTVGSKEGWTPATFKSSRTNRSGPAAVEQKPEDFMDDEDLAEAAASSTLQTSDTFAGFGLASDVHPADTLSLRDTMGSKLLQRMGWRSGQGIGAKIRRRAEDDAAGRTFLFAPQDVVVAPVRASQGSQCLGYVPPDRLEALADGALGDSRSASRSSQQQRRIKTTIDTNSSLGDEDVYDMGPRLSFGRASSKKKSKPRVSKEMPLRSLPNLVRVGDFVLAASSSSSSTDAVFHSWPPPPVPAGWVSQKKAAASTTIGQSLLSEPNNTTQVTHNPKTRAELLNEKALPGKSVFDYLSSSARDRVVSATGKQDLPPARGEAWTTPANQPPLSRDVPLLDKPTAVAALARVDGKGPYHNDNAKQTRYETYLKFCAGLLEQSPKSTDSQELTEFNACANIFRPMSGVMASRFTTAATGATATTTTASQQESVVPEKPPLSAAEEAARLGMYGSLTRTTGHFQPTRLLCKRFNVPMPSTPADEAEAKPLGEINLVTATAAATAAAAPPLEETPTQPEPVAMAAGDVLQAIFGDDSDED